jgi:hypothetical protein
MRAVVVVVGLLACSQPAKRAEPPTPPIDGAVDVDAGVAQLDPADAAEPRALAEKDFDWEKIRQRVEAARAERKGKPPPRPCGEEAPGRVECSPRPSRLAARGRLLSPWPPPPDRKTSTLMLDLGSDDGVSEYHWAAVLDENDNPITKYQHVENIRRSQCLVRLELASFVGGTFANGVRVALVPETPPPEARAPEL